MPYHGSVNFKFANYPTDMRRKCFSENGLFFDTFTTEAGEKMCRSKTQNSRILQIFLSNFYKSSVFDIHQ